MRTGRPGLTVGLDNEYSQSPITHAEYFAELEAVYHNSTINVPLTYNDPGEGSNFINGTVRHCALLHYDKCSPSIRVQSISMGA